MKNLREEFNIRFKDRHVAEYTKEDVDKFTREEYEIYFERIKQYRDLKNSIDTAMAKGKAKGRAEEKLEIAKKLKTLGVPFDQIAIATKLSINQIQKLTLQ